MNGSEVCGRPTTTKRPCRQKTARLAAWLSNPPHAPACGQHMTPEERTAWQARKAQHDRDCIAAYLRTWKGGDPACWSWNPMPEGGDWWEWHPFVCAICGHEGGPRGLVIDHDHATGLIRGRLCHRCNVSEGMGRIEGDVFDRYRQRHPASMWGFRDVYVDPLFGPAQPQVEGSFDEIAAVVDAQAAALYGRAKEKPRPEGTKDTYAGPEAWALLVQEGFPESAVDAVYWGLIQSGTLEVKPVAMYTLTAREVDGLRAKLSAQG